MSTPEVRDAPSPPGWPLLGHLPRLRSEGMLQLIESGRMSLGDAFSIDIGVRAFIFSHPEAIKRVLASNAKNYVKGEAYDGVRRVIGNGVLALEGDAWKARRTLMNPAFHRSALSRLTAAMAETGAQHFDRLREAHGTAPFSLDVHREMVKLTLDVVTVALFGKDLLGAADLSYEALGASLELVSERGNGFVLPKWVPTPGNRKFHRTMQEVEGAIYRVIAAGRQRAPGDGTLLSMLTHSVDAETQRPLTDHELRDEVFTLFVAGHETTALTLTWLFTLLDGHEDVVRAMRAEVDSVLGGRAPGFEDYPKLPLLKQVIDETLRLRGPVAMTARNVVADDEVGGVRVPAGAVVMPYFYGAHRHRDFWTNPDAFDPSRFSPEHSAGRHPWSYLPFSAGQRVCIGNTFSLVETVVLLAQLLQRFDVQIDPSVREVKPVAMVTVRPDRAVKVTLQARART